MKLVPIRGHAAIFGLVGVLLLCLESKTPGAPAGIRAPAAQADRPDLDYFPSRLHAAIFRNWEIVPRQRLAATLSTDEATIRKTGKALGLTPVPALSPEEILRNVEIVLRRNWGLFPRPQIDQLLGMSAQEVDEFLGKEIFLRALLAGQPDGLTPLSYQAPEARTEARVNWFAERIRRHLRAVASTPEEPRLAYITELCRAHNPADFIPGIKPGPQEIDLRAGWTIEGADAESVLKTATRDFKDYCEQIQHAKLRRPSISNVPRSKTIHLALDPALGNAQGYSLAIGSNGIKVTGGSESGVFRGLIELERRMAERGGPFLAAAVVTNRPAFSPRYVSSYFSLLTDVLGQDLVDPFPDGYLNELAHQDADGVWVYTLLQDLVPSPVFDGLGAGSEARLQRLRNLVTRAGKYGLKVYVYLNEPRAQFLSFFDKYPEAKGQVQGNTAALCTSTEVVQKHLRGSFERLFREVPGLGGVFVITASENLSNCYSHTRHPTCPRCSKRPAAEVIAESVRLMAEGPGPPTRRLISSSGIGAGIRCWARRSQNRSSPSFRRV